MVGSFNLPKPVRHVSEYKKGRTKYKDKHRKRTDLYDEEWRYLVDFQAKTGIRRAELTRLTGKDFVFKDDEWNVFVKNGKGGKDSYIYIHPDDVEFIRKYFEGKGADEKIFEEHYFKNELNLHFLRAKNAQRVYKILEEQIKNDPDYADELVRRIRKRWNECNINKKNRKTKTLS